MVSVMTTMRSPTAISLACIVLLAAILLAGCTLPGSKPASTPAATPTPAPETTAAPVATATLSCGLMQCHGIDVTCGPNPPQACTTQYKLGDRCRKYLHCESRGGTCVLVKDAGFSSCKTCTDECDMAAGPDLDEAQRCEEKC